MIRIPLRNQNTLRLKRQEDLDETRRWAATQSKSTLEYERLVNKVVGILVT